MYVGLMPVSQKVNRTPGAHSRFEYQIGCAREGIKLWLRIKLLKLDLLRQFVLCVIYSYMLLSVTKGHGKSNLVLSVQCIKDAAEEWIMNEVKIVWPSHEMRTERSVIRQCQENKTHTLFSTK